MLNQTLNSNRAFLAEVEARWQGREMPSIHMAARFGKKDVVQYHLIRGVNVNAIEAREYRPLHYAAMGGYTNIGRLLLQQKAEVNVLGDAGETPLKNAAQFGNFNFAKLLLEHGADVNMSEHNTPLHSAIFGGYINVIKLLINHGAEVNLGDSQGYTPLDSAFCYKNTHIAKILLKHGAKLNRLYSNPNSFIGIPLKADHHRSRLLIQALIEIDIESCPLITAMENHQSFKFRENVKERWRDQWEEEKAKAIAVIKGTTAVALATSEEESRERESFLEFLPGELITEIINLAHPEVFATDTTELTLLPAEDDPDFYPYPNLRREVFRQFHPQFSSLAHLREEQHNKKRNEEEESNHQVERSEPPAKLQKLV